jgi:hypothetical protein
MIQSQTLRITFNAVGFQAAWWLSALGPLWGMSWLGPLAMLLFLVLHFRFSAVRQQEILFILTVGLIGTFIDSLFAVSGMLIYAGGYGLSWLAPLWITAMWLGFTSSMHHALRWLKSAPILGFITGAVFGPLSYYTGMSLGVIESGWPLLWSMVVLALVWGATIPILYRYSRWLGVQ